MLDKEKTQNAIVQHEFSGLIDDFACKKCRRMNLIELGLVLSPCFTVGVFLVVGLFTVNLLGVNDFRRPEFLGLVLLFLFAWFGLSKLTFSYTDSYKWSKCFEHWDNHCKNLNNRTPKE